MKHITIIEYGTFLGLKSSRLCIYTKDKSIVKEIPLSHLKTITITKKGVSLSSDLILELGLRGVKLFLISGRNIVSLSGSHQHAVAKTRQRQIFHCSDMGKSIETAKKIIISKIKNQRSTLLSFTKHHAKDNKNHDLFVKSDILKDIINKIKNVKTHEKLLGFEGVSASIYWQCLISSQLTTNDFHSRLGRNGKDNFNKALNYGYAILQSYVWNTVINAGLEPYIGFMHVQRPGKPSLILDIMEEYRSWVVDRCIIKLRKDLENDKEGLSLEIRKKIVAGVHETMSKKYVYNKRKMKLESIMQRQVYKLSASFQEDINYKTYTFRW